MSEAAENPNSENLEFLGSRPNVLVIWGDNLGWGDISAYGCPYYSTPHIDSLAKNGIRFVNAYAAAPACTPSRVGFLTGRYPARLPIGTYEGLPGPGAQGSHLGVGLSADVPSIASLMKAGGYATCLVGKWHCGHLPAFSPLKSGFDEFFGHKTGSLDYFRHVDEQGLPDLWEGDQNVEHDGYITDLYNDRAVEFVSQRRDVPFFLCLWHSAPHWPWQGPGDKYLSDDLSLREDASRFWPQTGTSENYADTVKCIDAGVGRLIEALRTNDALDNTLIIFSSDHGGDEMAHLGPLRRGSLHEGGLKVPLILSWPEKVPRGRVSRHVVIGFDQTATVLAAAGVSNHPDCPLEGRNLLDITSTPTDSDSPPIFWRYKRHPRVAVPLQRAMRDGPFKYFKIQDAEYLYNLELDPGETQDVKDAYPDIMSRLRAAYEAWEKQMVPY